MCSLGQKYAFIFSEGIDRTTHLWEQLLKLHLRSKDHHHFSIWALEGVGHCSNLTQGRGLWDSKMVCKAASQLYELIRECLDSITTVVILKSQRHTGEVTWAWVEYVELLVVILVKICLTRVPTVPTQFHPKNLTSSTRPLTWNRSLGTVRKKDG